MRIVDILPVAGFLLGGIICALAHRQLRAVRSGNVALTEWSLVYDGGLMVIFTLASEAFAVFFLSEYWMAVACAAIISFMSCVGGWNRLKARQKEHTTEPAEAQARVRTSFIIMSSGVELALLSTLAWQLLRLFL